MKGTVGAGGLGRSSGFGTNSMLAQVRNRVTMSPRMARINVSFTADAFHDVKLAFDAALKPVFVRSSVKPERILHFTDASGLLAILRDRRVWLGRARNSNDSMEIQHGLNLATQAISKRLQSTDSGRADVLLLEEARRVTEFGYGQRYDDDLPVLDAHVACFADGDRSNTDSLLHWALYGRKGRGFAIDFDTARLRVGGERADLIKIEYASEIQAKEVEAVIEHFLAIVRKRGSSPNNDLYYQYAGTLAGYALAYIAVAMKQSEYNLEHEWRLVAHHMQKDKGKVAGSALSMNFAVTSTGLKSYFEFDFPHEAVTRIIVGAQASFELVEPVIRMLLEENGYKPIPSIVRSALSLR